MLLSNWSIIIVAIMFALIILEDKLMDSKLSSSISALASAASNLGTAVDKFIAGQGTPIITADELPGLINNLDLASSSINDAVNKLTPTSVTVTSVTVAGGSGTVSAPATPPGL